MANTLKIYENLDEILDSIQEDEDIQELNDIFESSLGVSIEDEFEAISEAIDNGSEEDLEELYEGLRSFVKKIVKAHRIKKADQMDYRANVLKAGSKFLNTRASHKRFFKKSATKLASRYSDSASRLSKRAKELRSK